MLRSENFLKNQLNVRVIGYVCELMCVSYPVSYYGQLDFKTPFKSDADNHIV